MNRDNIRQQILISGVGGQGVLFLTRILAQSALEMCLEVISSETHGMAMRGGSVASHMKVGAFRSPLIRSGNADVMLVMDSSHASDYLHFVKEGGTIILNSAAEMREMGRREHPAHRNPEQGAPADLVMNIDATGVAAEMGIPQMSNIVLLGFTLARNALFCSRETVESAILQSGPRSRVESNMKALDAGFSRGR